MNVTFLFADQHWMDEMTVYWFQLSGVDQGTGVEFAADTFGVAESGNDDTVVDCDGCPLTEGDPETMAVRRVAIVTEAIRQAERA